MARIQPVIPWSWSLLSAYNTCPKQCYETRIAKNYKEDMNKDYILWGNSVHSALELRVRDGMPLPQNMRHWEGMAQQFANKREAGAQVFCELETAITLDLAPTGYWAEDCWNRGKEDILVVNDNVAFVGDYKTGKRKDDLRQLELSALRIFSTFPKVDTLKAGYGWLSADPNKPTQWTRATYIRDDVPRIYESFVEQIANMLWSEANNTWPARPSGLCKRSKKPGSSYAGCIVANCPHSEFYKGNK